MATRSSNLHSLDSHLFATTATLGIVAPNINADIDDDCSDVDDASA